MTTLLLTPAERQAAEDTLVALGNTDIVRASWRPDGEGVVPDGFVGGDDAGESVSVRYLNRYAPNARITCYFHVVDACGRDNLDPEDADGARYFVEEMVESYVADRRVTDEDAQERWSDYEYHRHERYFATEAEAEAERDRLAALDSPEDYAWDGAADRARRR